MRKHLFYTPRDHLFCNKYFCISFALYIVHVLVDSFSLHKQFQFKIFYRNAICVSSHFAFVPSQMFLYCLTFGGHFVMLEILELCLYERVNYVIVHVL